MVRVLLQTRRCFFFVKKMFLGLARAELLCFFFFKLSLESVFLCQGGTNRTHLIFEWWFPLPTVSFGQFKDQISEGSGMEPWVLPLLFLCVFM